MNDNLIFKKETHEYFFNNKKLISVSKILNNYFGDSYQNVPKDILKKAANRGSAVHKILELYLKNKTDPDVINKLKNIINKKLSYNQSIINYCNSALLSTKELNKLIKNDVISEKPLFYDFIAGTPDLISNNLLFDFKTYRVMTKQLKLKSELQLTAYWWLAMLNGIKLSTITYILWIKENGIELIPVKINQKKLHEWKMARLLWKENNNE